MKPNAQLPLSKLGTLNIEGTVFDVLLVGALHPEMNDGGSFFFGRCVHVDNRIYLLDGMTPDRQKKVLLHEAIHAIDAELSLGLSEETISRLAGGLRSIGCEVRLE